MAKNIRPVLLATGAAVAVSLPDVFAAAQLKPPAVAASAAGPAAAIGVFAGFFKDSLLQRFQKDLENAAFVRDGCPTTQDELPLVRDVGEPTWLGVHAARRTTGRTSAGQPPYVPHDIDDELREHLCGDPHLGSPHHRRARPHRPVRHRGVPVGRPGAPAPVARCARRHSRPG
ncbi:hypothetical protein [Streptomyces sp. NPDC047869]|uniref:hypothetical protein n=1 Tax=Streptomyces sp. NPDC047869 TaxID=3154709 RepID=UPI00345584B3